MGLSPPSRPNVSASPPTPSVAFAYCSPGATATGTRPCRTSSPAPPRGDKGAVPSTPRALPSTHRSPLAPPRSLSCPRTRHLLQIHRRARSLPLASLCHGQQAHLASPLRPQRPPSSAASTTETKRSGTPSIVEPALCFHLRPPKAAAVVPLHRASPEPAVHPYRRNMRLSSDSPSSPVESVVVCLHHRAPRSLWEFVLTTTLVVPACAPACTGRALWTRPPVRGCARSLPCSRSPAPAVACCCFTPLPCCCGSCAATLLFCCRCLLLLPRAVELVAAAATGRTHRCSSAHGLLCMLVGMCFVHGYPGMRAHEHPMLTDMRCALLCVLEPANALD